MAQGGSNSKLAKALLQIYTVSLQYLWCNLQFECQIAYVWLVSVQYFVYAVESLVLYVLLCTSSQRFLATMVQRVQCPIYTLEHIRVLSPKCDMYIVHKAMI